MMRTQITPDVTRPVPLFVTSVHCFHAIDVGVLASDYGRRDNGKFWVNCWEGCMRPTCTQRKRIWRSCLCLSWYNGWRVNLLQVPMRAEFAQDTKCSQVLLGQFARACQCEWGLFQKMNVIWLSIDQTLSWSRRLLHMFKLCHIVSCWIRFYMLWTEHFLLCYLFCVTRGCWYR